jgi:XapX domain-containing protein
VKTYVISLSAGLLAGLLYGLLGVRSPAPPVVALIGLLGLLVGEQAVSLAKRLARGESVTRAWFVGECAPQITGVPATAPTDAPSREREDKP